ncbi:RagB/SusD family nutrient uptake outer membrane protein [Pseudoflavitalea sp. X16]|uniref:RagB/SusD family nutrient uptake outer membrane protein n=1 Tax=Paraflavitalea devenefica TaxID=2716334 RepID=UPI001421BF7B|nr:RagB/SusD family nutrient uptake outer membrane protein [Paraflavitalea devenefica]NII29069.1 RagB/SusD family nutrient uptake outer membrane protein [Paraflavitalea devenefica]
MRKTNLLYLSFLFLLVTSCKKWVEVTPVTQIEDKDFFANEQGFKEALNGVYLNMGRVAQYGREFTFGMADVIGGMYVLNTSNGSQAYRDALAGLYTATGVQGITTTMWQNQYNSIANLNKLIEELDKADTNLFKPRNYRIIKGEALGLRAFLHLDLLRYFGTSIAAGGAEKAAIPYVEKYAAVVTPRSTHAQVLVKIQADLEKAAQLLQNDPILTGETITTDMDNGYLMNRKLRFNYYAVKATEARVNLWAGQIEKALPAAETVITATAKFPWVAQASVATSDVNRDRVFTTEHIFGLFVNDLAKNYVDLLDTSRFSTTLVITSARVTEQFETNTVGASDYRNVYLVRNVTNVASPKIFFGKLYQPNGMPVDLSKRVPLIRIPEMYYIAAECLKETNPAKAIEYLTTVRSNRGITAPLSSTLTAVQIQDELRKEYRKEFPSEGQMFFYYKRVNSTSVPGVSGAYPTARYVVPLPPAEVEFGQ